MPTEPERRKIAVQSTDGVSIVGAASGAGPALLLVYGAMMEQMGWARLAPFLQPGRTLCTYDRRGRGESTDAPLYAVQREVDDLLAFAEALPQPLDLFGHSSGALLVLHALVQGLPARRVVLYEPLLASARTPRLSSDLPDRVRSLIVRGQRDAALELFLREGMEVPAEDIDRLRAGPRWQEQLRYIETGVYDSTVASTYVLEPRRLARIKAPMLLIAGSESPAWIRDGVQRFAEALPHARIAVLEGQGHNAQFTAPELLATTMRAFLDEEGGD